jgi:hypothetical protein
MVSLLVVFSAPAFAQTSDTTPPAQTPPRTIDSTQAMPAPSAEQLQADAKVRLENIKHKGEQQSARRRADAEAKITASIKRLNTAWSAEADQQIAERLAGEFGLGAPAILAEKQQQSVAWGDLIIALTLKANSTSEVTVPQLLWLHKEEKLTWAQIAAGLDLSLGDTANAVRTECKVATGQQQPDGRVAVIGGPGAKATNETKDARGNSQGVGAGQGLGSEAEIQPPKVKPSSP